MDLLIQQWTPEGALLPNVVASDDTSVVTQLP
jgi:hypothetical protein